MSQIEKSILTGQIISLRAAQVRILAALSRARGPVTADALCDRADFDRAWVGEYLGSHNIENRTRIEERAGFPSLATLGAIKIEEFDSDGSKIRAYAITAKGRELLAANKE